MSTIALKTFHSLKLDIEQLGTGFLKPVWIQKHFDFTISINFCFNLGNFPSLSILEWRKNEFKNKCFYHFWLATAKAKFD